MVNINSSGQLVAKVNRISQIGHGVTGMIRWEIVSNRPLTSEELSNEIDKNFPYAGYGPTSHTATLKDEKTGEFRVILESFASCD